MSIDLGRDILNRLKFDNKTKDKVLKLIEYHDYRFEANLKSVRKAMAKMGTDLYEDYIAVQLSDIKGGQAPDKLDDRALDLKLKLDLYHQVKELSQCTTIKDLAINGGDLIKLGLKPGGAKIGEVLNGLLVIVIEEPEHNNREKLIEEAKKMIG